MQPPAELEQHAFLLDHQADHLAEQVLFSQRGPAPRLGGAPQRH